MKFGNLRLRLNKKIEINLFPAFVIANSQLSNSLIYTSIQELWENFQKCLIHECLKSSEDKRTNHIFLIIENAKPGKIETKKEEV